jgi:hypothetical protein
MLGDAGMRARLGEAAAKTARQKFSIEHVVARTQEIYTDLLSRKRPEA